MCVLVTERLSTFAFWVMLISVYVIDMSEEGLYYTQRTRGSVPSSELAIVPLGWPSLVLPLGGGPWRDYSMC
jgi:hypothetical protein